MGPLSGRRWLRVHAKQHALAFSLCRSARTHLAFLSFTIRRPSFRYSFSRSRLARRLRPPRCPPRHWHWPALDIGAARVGPDLRNVPYIGVSVSRFNLGMHSPNGSKYCMRCIQTTNHQSAYTWVRKERALDTVAACQVRQTSERRKKKRRQIYAGMILVGKKNRQGSAPALLVLVPVLVRRLARCTPLLA